MRFILVDRIVALDPGRTIQAEKTMSSQEEFFRDHFPGFPVVPGVLLTEMMAQAAGKCLDTEPGERGKAMLARINSATFREWVRPGQLVTLFASVRSSRSQFATVDCRAEVAGRPVCSAELFFSFMPRAQFAPDYRDEVLEDYHKRAAACEAARTERPEG